MVPGYRRADARAEHVLDREYESPEASAVRHRLYVDALRQLAESDTLRTRREERHKIQTLATIASLTWAAALMLTFVR